MIGNEAVHPGELDQRDDQEAALELFALVNVIANNRISEADPGNLRLVTRNQTSSC